MAEGTRKDPQEYQREYNEFMYKLRRFLASKDIPMKKLPLFGGEEIDLYLLYKTVTDLGGWLKVTDERKWHEVANCFNIPSSCLNSAFALRQLYVRYLERYEKLYFLGEEGDDQTFPRLNFYNVGSSSYCTSPAYKDPQKNFERLVLSLQSGLPNEVDFAVNICMLLSNVNNSVFNLAKAPAIVDMMLAHVGVFLEDLYGTSELYKEWYKASGKDFLKFWNRILNSEEIKELLPKDDSNGADSEQFCAKEIFNLDIPAAHADFELQRVLQVCTILHNFSFDKTDAAVLSSHPVCMRFLLFCLHSNIGSLKKLATDTMTNLADKMVLEPLESLNSQLFFFMVDRYVCDSDRHNRICGMNILKKICIVEENQDSVCKALDIAVYEALVKVLILEDVQLLVSSLETLYQLTALGQVPCDHMVTIARSIEILVSLLSVCVEAYGAEVLSMVKVIDNYHGMIAAKHSQAKGVVNSSEQVHRADTEAEAIAQQWLRVSYDVDAANTILQRDLYSDYLTCCGKLGRGGILNSSLFYRILKFMFPDVQVVKLNTGQQQLFGLVGIRKKVASEQSYGQTASAHKQVICRTPTPPLRATSPTARTVSPSLGMETNFMKVGNASRTPTPPLQRETPRRCDGQTLSNSPGLPMATQSSTLPVERPDIIIPRVSSSPHAVQSVMVANHPQTRMPNALRPSIQTNVTPLPQTSAVTNDPVMKSQFPGNLTIRPSLNGNVVILNPQAIPSSSATLAQRHVSTVRITSSQNNLINTPVDSFNVRKPDVVQGVVGAPNGVITAGSSTFKTTLPLRSEHAIVRSTSNQSRTSQVVQCIDNNSTVMVNGVAAEKLSLKNTMTSVIPSSGVTERLSTVNGTRANGVSDILYAAKEEQTTKMAHQAHEVTISVVENPSKQTLSSSDQSKSVLTCGLVPSSSRKRTQPLSNDNSNVDISMNLNGPFVASAMLRNVAKRQRHHSDGGSVPLVNGVGSGDNEQKDPTRSHQKASVTSPKMPITVINGIRRDLLFQQVEVTANKPDVKTNPLPPGHPTQDSLSTNVVGNHSSSTLVTPSTTNPVLGSVPSSVVSTHGQNTSAQPVVSNQSALGSRTSTSVVYPGSGAPVDNNSRGGDQAGGASGLYQCKWSGCSCSFANSKLLYNHAVNSHAPTDQLFTSCQWEGCSHVRRSRASLLFHLRQRHLNLAPPSQVKDPNLLPKPQQAPTIGAVPSNAQNQPSAPTVHGRSVYPPHPSVNPLLMSLKEQLLQTEHESPLTKSVRLTAALILRNIARYSPAGRRKLKRYESCFAEIMCSKVESNVVVAACLHEMTRRRQEEEVATKR